MCDKNPDCFNSKTLVLDTNFLDQVNRTIRAEFGSFALGKSIEEQRPIFLTRAQEIIKNIGRCGGGHVFTSEKVYDDEVDISKMDSALRTADPEFFDNLCMDAGFIRDLSEVYQNGINIEELTEMEVRAFQDNLSEDVGLADAGLALLGLKQSQDQEAIVITDDLKLTKAIKDLRGKLRVAFEGDSLTTENLYDISSLTFLRNLHSCCEVSNNRWMAVIWSFTEHQIKRYDGRQISQEIYQEHLKYADQCIAQMLADCEAKKQREERNEYYRLFGVSDE
jgi:hypothetical protein